MIETRNGNRITCESCGKTISPKRGSRRQQYCGARCRENARRARNFEIMGRTSPAPRSVENTLINSAACKGDFADRASLIKRAFETEFAARWPLPGLRSNNSKTETT